MNLLKSNKILSFFCMGNKKNNLDTIMTNEQLKELLPTNRFIDDWHQSLDKFLFTYEINTPRRVSSFISQCGHESLNFTVLRENLNYRWGSLRKVWPRHFPTDEIAKNYERQPQRIANRAYANRMGNGPESSGDGWKYAGKGLIQLTGKNNYIAFATSINMSLEEVPEYIVSYDGAVESACWFWKKNNLNRFADTLDNVALTRAINGGTHGLDDRQRRLTQALRVLKAT
jgi:putative chitinase